MLTMNEVMMLNCLPPVVIRSGNRGEFSGYGLTDGDEHGGVFGVDGT